MKMFFILGLMLVSFVFIISPDSNAKGKEYKIGDKGPAGGWVFYDKGNTDGGWRYLEAAPEDLGSDVFWGNRKDIETGAIDTAIGTGKSNTQKILAAQGEGTYAAKICTDYRGGGKKDWFLPSKDELRLIQVNLYKNNIGGLTPKTYWSSSEVNPKTAWFHLFGNINIKGEVFGEFQAVAEKPSGSYVRAIRAFK